MDLGAAVVADEQPLEVMEPGEGALNDPAGTAEAGAVPGLPTRDLRGDAASAELAPVFVVVVAAVGGDALGPSPRPARRAPHRRDTVNQRDQLGDVVAVATGERPGEWDPGRIDQEVVLGARSGSINRARARFGAPFFACT